MKSNRMVETLDALMSRVTAPELGLPASTISGAVITALNEEAVAAAALANKGGINIIVTYEAFGAKMHGAVQQEATFAVIERVPVLVCLVHTAPAIPLCPSSLTSLHKLISRIFRSIMRS
jgi:phosphoketolase